MNQAIITKLGIDKFDTKAFLRVPSDVSDFEGLEYDTELSRSAYDLIFCFVFTLQELKDMLYDIVQNSRLNDNGVLYLAYPKKGNKKYATYIHRDEILPAISMDEEGYVLESTVKFNKMVAFDEVFTIIGLKNVQRRTMKSAQPSQCVGDYIDRIPELEALLADIPEILMRFKALTPGYQRGWARYVFGVKSAETSQRRLKEMANILREGFKSIDLYRQSKK